MIKERTLAKTLQKTSESYPVILVTGPRQVGKTTLLEYCNIRGMKYVTLDDFTQAEIAQTDPMLFLQMHQPPVIIDEVQYAPDLFRAIKIYVDKEKKPGMFWLTGSQKFHLMEGITETLAGRVAILDMLGLSQSEIDGRLDIAPFLPTKDWINNAKKHRPKMKTVSDIYVNIWKGSYPKMVLDKNISRDIFYKSYIQTYIQRDVRDITKVDNLIAFQKFLRAVAARTGQLVNYADLARDVDIDQKTAKSWLAILEASALVYLLYPYHNNVTTRLIKTPKLYFLDTGLCAYLTQWSSPESLEAGAMSGAILETYIFTEILKSYWHNGKEAYFYFYRDKDQKEIDLIIEQDGALYPVEFKKTASPNMQAAKNFSVLDALGKNVGDGGVICLCETDILLSRSVSAIPVWYL